MNEDFYIALITGWLILFIFWFFIVVFIYVRKPLKSKLSNKLILYSFGMFLIILASIVFLKLKFKTNLQKVLLQVQLEL